MIILNPSIKFLFTLLSFLNAIPIPNGCYPRDHLEENSESFCILTMCRDPLHQSWLLSSNEMQLLARNGQDHILERLWNHGKAEILNDSQLSQLSFDPSHAINNDVVLINNANHGSAHLSMYFAFPAISILRHLNLNPIGIRHRIPNFDALAKTIPWTRDFLPLLQSVLFGKFVPTISNQIHSCHRSILFHEVNMRGKFNSIEVVPRWFLNTEIAQATATLIERHTRTKNMFQNDERHMLEMSRCEIVIILREKNLQGGSTTRHITNEKEVVDAVTGLFKSIPSTGNYEVCRIYFDETSLGFQIQIIRRAKVVVGVHGAALTNIAWLNADSILIELFPKLVWNHGMYKGLTMDVGGIYRSLASTEMDLKGCMEGFVEMYGIHDLKRKCTSDMECSGCSRDSNVTVDINELVGKLTGAWEERLRNVNV